MLINMKDRVDEEAIQELLGYAIGLGVDKLQSTTETYRNSHVLELYGCVSEDHLVGIIGCAEGHDKQIIITHLAVNPDSRGAGFGRGMILELIELKEPSSLHVETDEEAVDFYRSIGFVIESLGEKYPGVERFSCKYEVDKDTDEE
ncbi:GNAT family N-acetyltransferase [Paenibacillus sp. N1-5-1-14]|uniref:GNAT family N-acetyltransferase n=1 Tax=Paenibacillus radicibacter TaxID=2972488 RepID=UPI0021596F0F|nr:GNAT family N-acetyltransferase [Paenibacillus radicibacter]MCR8641040.1 GNAT family N-acetyltransferase [Paenibacillus radicibacter]